MFEAFVADLLASYLGFFLDVKREKLRISLWSGDPLPVPHACMDCSCPCCARCAALCNASSEATSHTVKSNDQ